MARVKLTQEEYLESLIQRMNAARERVEKLHDSIKPCPFCGGKAEHKMDYYKPPDNPCIDYVECEDCKTTSNFYAGTRDAIAAWNRRAT